MHRFDLRPDEMTLASAISACSQLGDLKFGSWIESFIHETGIQLDDYLTISLIDLYAKCGSIDKAYKLFRGLKKKDLAGYTAMILGCGINGRANDAIVLFDEMMNAETQFASIENYLMKIALNWRSALLNLIELAGLTYL
ncbi:Pentatricopeptide repeat-containing protein [Capsicum chinense]|nr:Pentatricopeptide repeat-containing protein [Capsicum chinense]